jgi:HEAT repeats/Putative zinc-finger
MSGVAKFASCNYVAPLLVFYVCDEVDPRERSQIESHLASCPACVAQLKDEQSLYVVLTESLQPADQLDASGILLAQCRSELSETLDDVSAPPLRESWHPFGWMRQWMALRPVLSGAALVLFGLVLGVQLLPLLSSGGRGISTEQAVNVRPIPRFTEDQLSKMAIAGINFVPSSDSASGTVQLQLSAQQPLTLSGNLDDPDLRHILTFVVENDEHTDAGVKLDCLEALRAQVHDLQVRQALLKAARKDQNAAVRMKALESLRDSAMDESVRDALLDALEHDANSGVRVEAVNLLVHSLELERSETVDSKLASQPGIAADPSVERTLRMLADLQHNDPDRYVRQRSAAALRQIGPRELQ